MPQTTTIRVTKEIYDTVKSIAQQNNQKMQDVLEQAIKHYKKKKFFDDLDSTYARLRSDTKAWSDEETERQAWDSTLSDGIENEDDN